MDKEAARAQAKEKLRGLIRQVLADGVIDERERDEMQAFFQDAMLGVTDVKDVYLSTVGEVKDKVLEDGVLTADEADLCKRVVEQLRIPLRLLPADMVDIVTGRRAPDQA